MATPATPPAPVAEEAYVNENGSALYLEFRKEDKTYQLLIVPETMHPDTKKRIPALTLSRQTSSDHPRRQWMYKVTEEVDLPTAGTPVSDEIMAYTTRVSNQLNAYFNSMVAGDWKLFKTPLAADIGPDDIRILADKANQPEGLMRRVLRVREDAGFPISLYNESSASRY